MGKQILTSAILRCFRTAVFLLLVTCGCPLVRCSMSASNSLHNQGDFTSPYDSIFSPLLKALSEHGGSKWTPGLKKRMKPEHRYMKYLTEVFKKSTGVQRSLDGQRIYNTVRLIKPQEECQARSDEGFMQDISYSLDQIRSKEQLLKSALLYDFDHDLGVPVNSVCYLSIKEQGHSNQCQLCPWVHHAVNFTTNTDARSTWNWVEVDITWFLQPLLKLQKKNIHLLINITCPDEQTTGSNESKDPLKFTLRSPPLLLYLSDTSKTTQQRLQVNAKASQTPANAANALHKQIVFKPEKRIGRNRRWKRESTNSKRDDKSMDLPELLSSSVFPTSDCALYDFRVRFSQLKLDQWIVFPPKYNPRYCRGICPSPIGFMYGSPVHTIMQNIIYERLDSSVPRPSCIPSHYSPLSVMLFERDGSYVYKEYEEMVATRCTCR